MGPLLQNCTLEAAAQACSLTQHPPCKFCLERGHVTAANVVDHVEPHRGDWNAFVTGKLQSLCESCHNLTKKQIEVRGYRCDI